MITKNRLRQQTDGRFLLKTIKQHGDLDYGEHLLLADVVCLDLAPAAGYLPDDELLSPHHHLAAATEPALVLHSPNPFWHHLPPVAEWEPWLEHQTSAYLTHLLSAWLH